MEQDIDKHIGRARNYELPDFLRPDFKHVKKLEWITLAYLISVVVLLYLVMGSSQAMKAAWIEDVLGLFPSIAFLIASGIFRKNPNKSYPYGYHKAYTVAFVAASVALLVLGLYALVDSILSLVNTEHPTIGSIRLFGREIWMGWVMILALLYSFIPAMILGRKKLPFAKKLHEKVLLVDAQAQKADWMTAAAAIVGIIGIGFGLWWADAVAAIFISLNIVKDGYTRTKGSMKDLMEELPKTYDNKQEHPLVKELIKLSLKQEWVKDVRLRMREHGMVFFADLFVIPKSEENLIDNIGQLSRKALKLDWKIEDIVIHPVREFPDPNIREEQKEPRQEKVKKEVSS